MKTISKPISQIIDTLAPHQLRDAEALVLLCGTLSKDFSAKVVGEYEIYENSESFRYITIELVYKDFNFDISFNSKTGFGASLYKYIFKIPYHSNSENYKSKKLRSKPNNVRTYSAKKIIDLLEYEIENYLLLKELSAEKLTKISEYESIINEKFSAKFNKTFSFDNNFKEIRIVHDGVILFAKLNSDGHIHEDIQLEYVKDKIQFMYNLIK
jgi:hypothetical protein